MKRQIHHFRIPFPQNEFTIEDFPVSFRILQIRSNILVVDTELIDGKAITESRTFCMYRLCDIVEAGEFVGVIESPLYVGDDLYLYFKD